MFCGFTRFLCHGNNQGECVLQECVYYMMFTFTAGASSQYALSQLLLDITRRGELY